MDVIKLSAILVTMSAAVSGCSYTAPATKERPSYQTSSDCKTEWKHVKGIERYWYPGSVVPPNYIMYKNHLIQAWETIGDVYKRGCPEVDIAENKRKAFFWYQSAALAHVDTAQYKLGMMLIDGDGVPVDRKRGLDWLTSAAIEGSSKARAYLASIDIKAPPAIHPNSYETYQELARQALVEGERRDRAAVRRDLGSIAISVVKLVSEAAIVYTATENTGAYRFKPQIHYVQRTQPVYCYVYANSSTVFNTDYMDARVFCH